MDTASGDAARTPAGRAAEILTDVSGVTDDWLTRAVGFPVSCEGIAPLGEGHMADSYLVTVGDAPWPALVLKITSADAGSAAAAREHRSYEVEAGFYTELAPRVSARVPHCHWAAYDPGSGRYGVLLEHIATGHCGNQLTGLSPDDVTRTLEEVAALHAGRWGWAGLRGIGWLNRYSAEYREQSRRRVRDIVPDFLARHGDALSADAVTMVEVLAEHAGGYDRRGQDGVPTLAHGDLRADNLILGGERVCLLDWQTAFAGNALADVSYLLGGSVPVEDRRRHEHDQLRIYHHALTAHGVDLSWDRCWAAYRRYAFEGLFTAVISGTRLKRSDRGDQLFVTMTERAAQHALDLRSAEMLISG